MEGGDNELSDSDEEKEFEVKHYFVDFRHVFLQAHMQIILGKPKYQIKQEN